MSTLDSLRSAVAAAPGDRSALVDAFWAGPARRTPIVEEVPEHPDERQVTFLWRDADAHAVLLTVNKITLSAADGLMERIHGTDVWFRTFRLGSDWRGSYTILPLDAAGLAELEEMESRWAMRTVREQGRTDPRNPLTIGTHGGAASVAELPQARAAEWTDAVPARRGTSTEHRLPNGRRVWLHRPAGDDGSVARPLVVMLDGEIWQRGGDAATAVDALHEAGSIRTPYLLLVDAEGSRRMTDLHIDGDMSTEIAEVLVPWARSTVPISDDPSDVIVSGESLGGLTALKTVFDHPDVAGAALAQSSSLWMHDMLERATNATPVRLFLTAGRHEDGLIEPNRVLVAHLGSLAHEHVFLEFNGGHDIAWWRVLWADGIRHLLPR
ncbi:enterochelin esterase domain-containing protein [Microbacterium sp. CIAB417]|uniref:enterochelin esterase domain-containing protein n=1 Tax=Microbacterium sp. CIAB417 TaxID=2860287 RepID=UPI001FAE34DC|nr:enterochelin esterase domain-containing protein [Microbacterium sp. CIAB417]